MDRLEPNELLPGDVLLYHGKSLLARLIRFFDGTEMNHAALYLGVGKVGEALARGLVRQSLKKSIQGDAYVAVHRLKSYPETMEPVIRKAEAYLSLGNGYAYDQLLLLAFLGLTRKLPVNPFLKGLLRKIFDQAASWLTAQGERQPMICSEFVYRCYEEALPSASDPYTLEIFPLPRGLQAGRPKGSSIKTSSPGYIHQESLLAWVEDRLIRPSRSKDRDLFLEKGMGQRPRRIPSAEEKKMAGLSLKVLAERYLKAAKKPEMASRSLKETSLPSPGMLEGVIRFAQAWREASEPLKVRKRNKRKGKRKGGDLVEALENLLETAADFVTPGDLFKCQDLFPVGTLIPSER